MLPGLVRLLSHPHLLTAGLHMPYSEKALHPVSETLQVDIVTGLISKLTTYCLLKKGNHFQEEFTSPQPKAYLKSNSWIVQYKKRLQSFPLGLKLGTSMLWSPCLLGLSCNMLRFKKYSVQLRFSVCSHLSLISSFSKLSYYWHIHLYFPQA